MAEPQRSADDWLKEVAERMRDEKQAGAAPSTEMLAVREFLAKLGSARRGYRVVGEIQHKLEKHHLRTSPDFQFEYIDNPISIELDDDRGSEDAKKKAARS